MPNFRPSLFFILPAKYAFASKLFPLPLVLHKHFRNSNKFRKEIGAINILITRRGVFYPEKLRGKLFIFVFLIGFSFHVLIDYKENINSIVIS